jgi:hypothetical protein
MRNGESAPVWDRTALVSIALGAFMASLIFLAGVPVAVAVAVWVWLRSRAHHKKVLRDYHYLQIGQWVEAVLRIGPVDDPAADDAAVLTTHAGVAVAFSRDIEGGRDRLHFSISEVDRPTRRAVAGRVAYLIVQLLNSNRCEANLFFTSSGVHHTVLEKPEGAEWSVNPLRDAISGMASYRPLPFEQRW